MSDSFEVTLERRDGYEFVAGFPGTDAPDLLLDEPPPLGEGRGPNPSRLLAAAVGDCLSASLLFCLGKARVDVTSVRTRVQGRYRRNEAGRLRVGSLDVTITLEVADPAAGGLERCLSRFEDYCVVTASVRAGVDVAVRVRTLGGEELWRSP